MSRTVKVEFTERQARDVRHSLLNEARCYDMLLAEKGSSMTAEERQKAFSAASGCRETARLIEAALNDAPTSAENGSGNDG